MQYPVRVEKPNPVFARALQQAIGGIEGEMRVCLQYLFQAWNSRGPVKYRDMLMNTGTEEIGHIEMLATAVAMNLEGASVSVQEEAANHPIMNAAMGGVSARAEIGSQLARHVLSSGQGAMATDSDGVPFNGSWVVGSGNIAADMYANVMAESTGRLLATRLWEMTDDPGMKDMLSFLIARDTMHQNQWLAVLEELGQDHLPIPNSFPQEQENQDFNYAFFATGMEPQKAPDGRWAKGKSIDGKGQFSFVPQMTPVGEKSTLGPPNPKGHAQVEQMMAYEDATDTSEDD
jgi:Mn-containing catalase